MDRAEYLASYCASIDCTSKMLGDCDLCMYNKGRADAINEIKHQMISLHTDMIFRYGADIIEAKCDAFDELKEWLKEQR